MPVQRFSSRMRKLDESFLTPKLRDARAYDRIAGYFRSSILEVAGEAIESVAGKVRMVCNSDLDPQDVLSAKAAHEAMRREWCASQPEALADGEPGQSRFARLHRLLASGKLEVRVLPNDQFGFIHGKAGVITLADGRQTAFLGSVNESYTAWRINYELLWEDDSADAVRWVQDEFDALWRSPLAFPLARAVVEDIERISRRTVIAGVPEWRAEAEPNPAAPIIEAPVYRQEAGLWEHQKYFVNLAFKAHRGPHGARFVLADQVGLGKTLQLAMAAELMALVGDKPVLVLAPKPLVWQWQDELRNLLDLPSAVWNGKQWVDENEIAYPNTGPQAIMDCPRRIGIVSTGLITRKSEVADWLTYLDYECVILDEAHRARRRNLQPDEITEQADPNNLLRFMQRIAPRAKSLLLATATPVQLHPIEAWDLLDVLNRPHGSVLGVPPSRWRSPELALPLLMAQTALPTEPGEMWEWWRNPFPPISEGAIYSNLRRNIGLSEKDIAATPEQFDRLSPPDKSRVRNNFKDYIQHHNPFLRHIVRRTREFLENEINPDTHEPYLKPVRVRLHGEDDRHAIQLTVFLRDAYQLAEDFCALLSTRAGPTGFFKTLLLRRTGSTIEAGRRTALTLLGQSAELDEAEDEDDDEADAPVVNRGWDLTEGERRLLVRFVETLQAHAGDDPKYHVVQQILIERKWLEQGCIIFSQYYDSIWWLARQLSQELPDETIGIYAGANRSGLVRQGKLIRIGRDELKARARRRDLRLLLGTDAASEGLNLQMFGSLINLDLPWNPTRLEQRKGRIQRIGQAREVVDVYNMRYAGSVEDRVHQLLSQRLQSITAMFGQLPDVLEDVWVDVAQGNRERAMQRINAVPLQHPFELRYDKIEPIEWESCAAVLNTMSRREFLSRGWKG